MRLVNAIALISILAGTFGCTSSDPGLPSLHPDMARSPDLTVLPDLAVPPDLTVIKDFAMLTEDPDANGIACGNLTCGGGLVCCVTGLGMGGMPMSSCAKACDADAGSVTIACDGPENCPKGNPCCGKLMGLMAPQNISCSAQPTDCSPAFDLQTRSGQTRLCHIDNDCTRDTMMGNMLTSCCTLNLGGQTSHVCLSKMIAGLIGLLGMGVSASCP